MSDHSRSELRAGSNLMRDDATGSSAELGRRELLQLLGASMALAGLSGCRSRRPEQILPYVRTPAGLTPGLPDSYATTMELDGFGVGLLVESHEGRPTKIEGNPSHPASLGAAGVYEQASILSLYDPTRLRGPRLRGAPATWAAALAAARGPRSWRPWFVLRPQSSPVTLAWLERLRERYPAARFCFHSALSRQAVYLATRAVYGQPLETLWDFTRARSVLSLGADFTSQGPMALRWARDFAAGRAPRTPRAEMSRLYVVESTLSPTGSVADHRLALRSAHIPRLAAALLAEVVRSDPRAQLPGLEALGALPSPEESEHPGWVRAAARDLLQRRGSSLVLADPRLGFDAQVLALALNAALGNTGSSLRLSAPVLAEPIPSETLGSLREAIGAGEVDALFVLDVDPLYEAEPALQLEQAFAQVPLSVQLTQHWNATSSACHWVLPLSHYLESWGDSRALDGTLSCVQPLIEPIGASGSVLELLAACAAPAAEGAAAGPAAQLPQGRSLLESHWRKQLGASFESEWRARLQRGVVPDSAADPLSPEPDWERGLVLARGALRPAPEQDYELSFPPSSLYDGRFAHNAWLLELPDPITKQSWGNALRLHPADARALGVSTGDVVLATVNGQSTRVPVFVLPQQARGTLALPLGYGQVDSGTLADGVGVATAALRSGASQLARVSLRPAGGREELAITQRARDQHGRDLALSTSLAAYRQEPGFSHARRGPLPSLLPVVQKQHSGPLSDLQWAMTIDTTLCTGCNACVLACQAENNVPVVGKREVQRGREMYWLRIDSYEEPARTAGESTASESAGLIHQPMACQHCETAPCEYVCPVNATVHSPDGLNEMVYNRCIGTRFCSNNCPYKVRRFNWFDYGEEGERSALERLQKNPDVTVRERGVMEKCTYCVQRIRGAERQARIERRSVQPGEVVTACQQACAAQAIQFAALSHADSPAVRWREEERCYSVLHELGTRPRTQYLAKIHNPNPELEL